MIYIFISGIYKEDDILLYFYSLDYWINWIFLLVISLCCGLMSTAQKERYEDVHMINNELKAENKELKYVRNNWMKHVLHYVLVYLNQIITYLKCIICLKL